MAIQVKCGYCGHPYTLADKSEGKHVRCNECSKAFQAIALVDESPRASVTKAAPKVPAKPVASPRRRRPDDDDFDDAPRRRGSQKVETEGGGNKLLLWVAVGVGGMFALFSLLLAVLLMRSAAAPEGPFAQQAPPNVVAVAPVNPQPQPVFPNPLPAPKLQPKKIDPSGIRPIEPPAIQTNDPPVANLPKPSIKRPVDPAIGNPEEERKEERPRS